MSWFLSEVKCGPHISFEPALREVDSTNVYSRTVHERSNVCEEFYKIEKLLIRVIS